MLATSDQLTPEEILAQKLKAALLQQKTPQPGQSPDGGTTPAPGAPVPGTGQAASAGNDPNKPTPPTIAKPQGMTGAPAAEVQAKPYETDEEWAKANPMAAPAASTFKEPGWKETLGRGLAYGAMEFGRPGEGARANSEWAQELSKERADAQNYPNTLHAAREKFDTQQADLENKRASTAEMEKRTELMGTSPEPKTTREALEAQYRTQIEKGDQKGGAVTLDMMQRLYPKDFKDEDSAEMAKIAPQVLAETGPKPVTPIWGPPGKPPTTYKSTAEAQAAWGQAVDQHAIDLAGKEEAAKAKAAAQNKPAPEVSWQLQETPDGQTVWVNPHTREVKPAEGVEKSGTHARTVAAQEKAVKPFQDTLDEISEAKDFAANPSATNDYGLTMAFIGVTKPESVSKLRLNPQELKLTIGARSSLGDAEAFATRVANGQSLTPEQRQQMISTMEIIEKYAKAGIQKAGAPPAAPAGAPGAAPAAGALPPGWK